jgi:hypothetical protein
LRGSGAIFVDTGTILTIFRANAAGRYLERFSKSVTTK